jgi:hypothetical protein
MSVLVIVSIPVMVVAFAIAVLPMLITALRVDRAAEVGTVQPVRAIPGAPVSAPEPVEERKAA